MRYCSSQLFYAILTSFVFYIKFLSRTCVLAIYCSIRNHTPDPDCMRRNMALLLLKSQRFYCAMLVATVSLTRCQITVKPCALLILENSWMATLVDIVENSATHTCAAVTAPGMD